MLALVLFFVNFVSFVDRLFGSSAKVTCVVRPARGVLSSHEGDFCAIALFGWGLATMRNYGSSFSFIVASCTRR